MSLRVLLVDDSPAVRGALRDVLDHHPELTVVGEATNGREGVELAANLEPHVVIIDLAMPIMDGTTAIPLIRQANPSARICVFSATRTHDRTNAAAALGADAFFDKTTNVSDIAETVLAVARRDL